VELRLSGSRDLGADEAKRRPVRADCAEREHERDEDQKAEGGRAVPSPEHGPDGQVGEHAAVDQSEAERRPGNPARKGRVTSEGASLHPWVIGMTAESG